MFAGCLHLQALLVAVIDRIVVGHVAVLYRLALQQDIQQSCQSVCQSDMLHRALSLHDSYVATSSVRWTVQ